VYEVASGKPAGPPLATGGVLTDAAFSPDGKQVGTAERNPGVQQVQLWDWRTGQPLCAPVPMPSVPLSLDYSPDGQQLAVFCYGGQLRVIHPLDGRILLPWQAHSGPFKYDGYWTPDRVRFSPDGQSLLTYCLFGRDCRPRVWDAATGKQRYAPLEHPAQRAFHAHFSPDGRLLTTTATDNTVRIWDFATGRPVAEPLVHPDMVFMGIFSADGSQVLTACRDGMARLWDWRTRMHIWTHLSPEYKDKTGLGVYPDGMMEQDADVGRLLKKLDDLGIVDNTIVMYSTDNGAETFTWPDGGTTPFRNEKNTNWEGGYRVPCLVRWPGLIKPGTEINDIMSHEDWVPTLMAAAGEPDITEKLSKGLKIGDMTYKVRLDGYDQRDLFSGKGPGKRKEFFYWTDDGQLCALRYDQWKLVFMEQKEHGLGVWQQPLTPLRVPLLFSVRSDPFERADHESGAYDRWYIDHVFVMLPAQAFVAQHIATYKDFPPRQKPGSFNLDRVLEKLQEAGNENR
jgi:hypothetical protein